MNINGVQTTISHIRQWVSEKREEIWIPRVYLHEAEEEFCRQIIAGKIAGIERREQYSCKGSVNYWLCYR